MSDQSDHDLLTRIDERMKLMSEQFTAFASSTNHRISSIEAAKQDLASSLHIQNDNKAIHEDHEKRIRRNERVIIGAISVLGFVQFIIVIVSAVK